MAGRRLQRLRHEAIAGKAELETGADANPYEQLRGGELPRLPVGLFEREA